MAESYIKNERLPSDPEFLLEYMDGIPSEDSDDDFDGYVDNPVILNDREATSSFQNYTSVPDDRILQVLAPPNSDNEHSISHNIPDANPPAPPTPFVHSFPTMSTPTLTEMFSTPINTSTPDQVLKGPHHQQRDQIPPSCKPGRYLYNTWLLHRNCK